MDSGYGVTAALELLISRVGRYLHLQPPNREDQVQKHSDLLIFFSLFIDEISDLQNKKNKKPKLHYMAYFVSLYSFQLTGK
jgi:hypothetical protein